MKRALCSALALVLAAVLAFPAAAASTDQRLNQVTQAVKKVLNVPDTYSSFYGDLEETEFQTLWSLNWEGEGESLRVRADEAGKVYWYSLSRMDGADHTAAFPPVSWAEAAKTAQAFFDRVLSGNESAVLPAETGSQAVGADQYVFRSDLLLYGLPTPVTVSATVDAWTGEVLRFSRSDQYSGYVGEIADPGKIFSGDAAERTAQEKAGVLLKSTLEMRIEYVLDDSGERAVLQYLPEPVHEYYVDTAGQLVDLTKLYENLEKGNGSAGSGDATAGEAADGSLTEAEQEGIAQMTGVQSKESLDRAVRAWKQLGLTEAALSSCSYMLNRETGEVTASLRYSGSEGWRRSVTVDAKTGGLLSVSGPTWGGEDFQAKVSLENAQATAESFLTALWPNQWKLCDLYDSEKPENGSTAYYFVYAQKENGYFFPTNSITVAVDGEDGTIAGLYRSFDADPDFDSAEGIITPEEALDAWYATYTVTLGYIEVPQALQDYGSRYQQLIDLGYSYLNSLELGYTLEQGEYASGIDAKTGAPVCPTPAEPQGITYSDLAGCWGREEAESLAAYGVGWLGGTLRPKEQLKQLDWMALLVSLDGDLPDLQEEGAADRVYERAYSMGLLARGDREDGRLITRGEVVRTLLDYGGYGAAAQIPGIFRCSFADEAAIPAEYYGYAAIARGLGMVQGDGGGNFAAGRIATRIEAVVMLYQFMNR